MSFCLIVHRCEREWFFAYIVCALQLSWDQYRAYSAYHPASARLVSISPVSLMRANGIENGWLEVKNMLTLHLTVGEDFMWPQRPILSKFSISSVSLNIVGTARGRWEAKMEYEIFTKRCSWTVSWRESVKVKDLSDFDPVEGKFRVVPEWPADPGAVVRDWKGLGSISITHSDECESCTHNPFSLSLTHIHA